MFVTSRPIWSTPQYGGVPHHLKLHLTYWKLKEKYHQYGRQNYDAIYTCCMVGFGGADRHLFHDGLKHFQEHPVIKKLSSLLKYHWLRPRPSYWLTRIFVNKLIRLHHIIVLALFITISTKIEYFQFDRYTIQYIDLYS